VFDLGYLGVEKDYPEQISHYQIEKREVWNCHKKKKNTIYSMLKKE
jgi:hypothetical protein